MAGLCSLGLAGSRGRLTPRFDAQFLHDIGQFRCVRLNLFIPSVICEEQNMFSVNKVGNIILIKSTTCAAFFATGIFQSWKQN